MYITFFRDHEYKGFAPSQLTIGPFKEVINNGDGKITVDGEVLVECKVSLLGVDFPIYKDEPWTGFHTHEAPESGLDLPVKPA